MKRLAWDCPWWLSIGTYALVLAAWLLSRLTAPESGSMEDLYKRVQVGMSQE
jgi:hypothetical protein